MHSEPTTIYTPAELNREVKLHLEAGFPALCVQGEVSNLAQPASGHLYFSLKDQQAQVRCALFRQRNSSTALRPSNGMLVNAWGRVSLYPPRGDFQFIVERLEEAGSGILQQQFEELKKKLAAEGLFDDQYKLALPAYPQRVAIVTSASGAAIRDIVHVLGQRWPTALRLYPAAVQGADAPAALRNALNRANREAWAEVIIIGRGGGSLEDLWAFNDEALARAIHASVIPVISAVGHETDFTIADFVADLRAATPSAAAVAATPDRRELTVQIRTYQQRLDRLLTQQLQQHQQTVDGLAQRVGRQHPQRKLQTQQAQTSALLQRLQQQLKQQLAQTGFRLRTANQRLSAQHPRKRLKSEQIAILSLHQRLKQQIQRQLAHNSQQLATLSHRLQVVSPLPTLARGYALVLNADNRQPVTSVTQVKRGQAVLNQLQDGQLECRIEATSNETLLDE